MFHICYWHLSCLIFSDLPGSVFWLSHINLRKSQSLLGSHSRTRLKQLSSSSSHYCFKYFLCSFLSFFLLLVFPLWVYHITPFTVLSHSPWVFSSLLLFFFFSPQCLFSAFPVLKFLLTHCQALSSALSSLLVSPSKASFIPVSVWGVVVLL